MPQQIDITSLGLTVEEAKNQFTGLNREQVLGKIEQIKSQNASNQNQIETFTDKVNKLNAAEKDPYKGIAVGAIPLTRSGESGYRTMLNVFTGGKKNFIAGIEQIANQETLDKLIAVKEAGGTFGSLTEKELDMLINASSKIKSWEIRDKKGKVTGYDIGEKYFNDELKTLTDLANKAITKAGGTPVPSNSGVTSSGIKYSIES